MPCKSRPFAVLEMDFESISSCSTVRRHEFVLTKLCQNNDVRKGSREGLEEHTFQNTYSNMHLKSVVLTEVKRCRSSLKNPPGLNSTDSLAILAIK